MGEAHAMEYRKQILFMLSSIKNDKLLEKIYWFIQRLIVR